MPAYKDSSRNTWYTKFSYKEWSGETKHITKRGFKTKREAQQWETEFKLQKAGSIDMKFDEFAEKYLAEKSPRVRVSTNYTKGHIVRDKIVPYFKDKRLRDITAADVVHWQNTLLSAKVPGKGTPYSKAYLKEIHNQLTAMFNYAIKFYGLKENPARIAGNMGSEKEIKMQFWTKEQYQAFAEAMMDDPQAFYCFEVLYWTGIREGELLALSPADFDPIAKTLKISKTFQHIEGKDYIGEPKTPKSNRIVSVPDFLCEELMDYLSTCYDMGTEDRMFPVTKHFLYHKMIDGSRIAGVPRIRIHDLRHSHVSLLISMGFSAVAIADRMGHESIDITYHYAHMFPTTQHEMANKLDALKEGF